MRLAPCALGVVAALLMGASSPVVVVDARQAAAAIEKTAGTRLLFIWEASCGPCRRVLPKVEKVAARWRDRGVRVLSFSIDEEDETLAAFLASRDGSLSTRRIESDSSEELEAALQEVGLRLGASFGTPLFAVIDGDGHLLGQQSGASALAAAEQWLDQASGATR